MVPIEREFRPVYAFDPWPRSPRGLLSSSRRRRMPSGVEPSAQKMGLLSLFASPDGSPGEVPPLANRARMAVPVEQPTGPSKILRFGEFELETGFGRAHPWR